jgi:hypothetical protein
MKAELKATALAHIKLRQAAHERILRHTELSRLAL